MSDYGESPPESPRRQRRGPQLPPLARIPDFSNVIQSLETLRQRLENLETREIQVAGELSIAVPSTGLSNTSHFPRPVISDAHVREMQDLLSEPIPRRKPAALKFIGPVVTLTSALPETTYKDQDDSKGTEKTPRYLEVQRMVLKYLEKSAADTLSSKQARAWTQAVDPTLNREPKAEEALRLCYYMRSQGYDVYSKMNIKEKEVSLFVVTQCSHERDAQHDRLYWHQNFMTNEDLFATQEEAPRPRRRNAMVGQYIDFGFGNDENEENESLVHRRTTLAPAARAVAPANQSVAARLAAAEVRLQRVLESENADPE
jgi:hypothetical protein